MLDRQRDTVVFALNVDATSRATCRRSRALLEFPSIRRDLAMVVDEKISAAELIGDARGGRRQLAQHVVIFDVYRGRG